MGVKNFGGEKNVLTKKTMNEQNNCRTNLTTGVLCLEYFYYLIVNFENSKKRKPKAFLVKNKKLKSFVCSKLF